MVGLGRLLLLALPLAQVEREASQPSAKATGRPSSQPLQVKFHRAAGGPGGGGSASCELSPASASSRRGAAVPRRLAPPARQHRQMPTAARARRPRAPRTPCSCATRGRRTSGWSFVLVVQREREQREKKGGSNRARRAGHRVSGGDSSQRRLGASGRAGEPSAGSITGTCASTDSRRALPGLK